MLGYATKVIVKYRCCMGSFLAVAYIVFMIFMFKRASKVYGRNTIADQITKLRHNSSASDNANYNLHQHKPGLRDKMKTASGELDRFADENIPRTDSAKNVYPLTINCSYLIENPTLCTSVSNLSVLVIVHTAPHHFVQRTTIRATWTNQTFLKHLGVLRVLFLLGTVKDDKIQQDIEEEFDEFGDLLQGDFVDAYKNLTLKGVMAFKWISEWCRNAEVILKSDDDMVVNMYKVLTKYVPRLRNSTKEILCHTIVNSLIIRDETDKWYVNEDEFKGEIFYPEYCSGFTLMITNDVIPLLFKAASVTPFFWVDDVYLYGLLPSNVPGLQLHRLQHENVALIVNSYYARQCYASLKKTCDYYSVRYDPVDGQAEKIWTGMRYEFERGKMS